MQLERRYEDFAQILLLKLITSLNLAEYGCIQRVPENMRHAIHICSLINKLGLGERAQ